MAADQEPGLERGLTRDQAAARLAENGPNLLPRSRPRHPALLFAAQLTHFFAVMLWVAAALAVLAGMPVLAVAIAVVVVLNGAFSFVQEYRADRAAERLRDLLPMRATVRRDGRAVTVDAVDLVVDDIVLVEGGDRVCADARVTGGRIALDESMLTGESALVRPGLGSVIRAGTYVVEGHAAAIVTATGGDTRLAGIAAVTEHASRPRSPLSRHLHRVVQVVAVIAVGVGVVFFALSLALGRSGSESALFAIGVTVALVPEGLLPTVTLSLARAAQRMAGRNALVRRLESVETLGATTFICTDKTGTLTVNQMAVVQAWTPAGTVLVDGSGYAPEADIVGDPAAVDAARRLADSAARCSPDAHAVEHDRSWQPVGDPMEVALHVLAARLGVPAAPPPSARRPFDPRRRRASAGDADGVHVTGAPDAVLPLCVGRTADAQQAVATMARRGLRTLAVALRPAPVHSPDTGSDEVERDLRLLGIVGLEDPPRPDVAASIRACRQAGIRVAMITGDHPSTAAAIAAEIGLATQAGPTVVGAELPADDGALGALLDTDGIVVARVDPEQKLRIARSLQARGHVVAMTGDGVNDGPALRAADIGVAMGASGTDVAREAADLVLLDDHFGTIVAAIELGRATFANIRRFLTYHLTDNVAELAPFVVWALTGGAVPLAIGVLQILALDIGTDLLPALALGAEPPNPRTMRGPARTGALIDRRVAARAFGVLGPAEAAASMTAFLLVLAASGWTFGAAPTTTALAAASGTAFTTIVLAQLANAFACRSETRWVGRTGWRGNPLLLTAVAFEVLMLAVFLLVPPLPGLLGGVAPGWLGWLLAAAAVPAVWLADTADKAARTRARSHRSGGPSSTTPERTRPDELTQSTADRRPPATR